MPVDRAKHDKQQVLRQHATLNPRPGGVTHALLGGGEFFDPDDLLQVKYEMLRLVNVDKRPISEAAKACGFSRPSFYQAQKAFQQGGLAGLIAHKPGPHAGHKLTPAVLEFVAAARAADPGVRADQLAERIHQRFVVQVHPRSIERQLLRKKNVAEPCTAGGRATRRSPGRPLRGTATPCPGEPRCPGAGLGAVHPARHACLDAGLEPVCAAIATCVCCGAAR